MCHLSTPVPSAFNVRQSLEVCLRNFIILTNLFQSSWLGALTQVDRYAIVGKTDGAAEFFSLNTRVFGLLGYKALYMWINKFRVRDLDLRDCVL